MTDLNIVVAGSAGEGVQTIGDMLADTVAAYGYAVFAWQEFESRIRGGQNRYSIRIGETPASAPLMAADILLALNRDAVEKYAGLLTQTGVLIGPGADREPMIALDFSSIAKQELGNRIYASTIAFGALGAAVGIPSNLVAKVVAARFAGKDEKIVAGNRAAAQRGYQAAGDGCRDICPWQLPPGTESYYLMAGYQALATAAVRAGCRFMAAYPMSPSTGIITFLAEHEQDLGVFVEQAEDEIAAVNMAIGAGFGGARAMTATSGGGFALMTEAISLAGMIETPVVIVLAQRPGPATGLPTRTAQGDLLFAVHAGHGEFPKLVLAPADAGDIFEKTVRAFDLADRYQVPVVLMVDQLLMDARFSVKDLDLAGSREGSCFADPEKITEYQRYRLTADGISPRLYPGQSPHLVTADSDEHDEQGHITEDLAATVPGMVEKRLAKNRQLKAAVRPPEETGLAQADVVLVGWGSSRRAILDGCGELEKSGHAAGMIHFTELWPLPEYAFPPDKQYWVVETNATGQLARLLRSEYGLAIAGTIGRYDGLPMTARYLRRCFDDR